MADNLEVVPGTGTTRTIAGDDIGGVLHQRVKVVIGADGVSNGDISATNPIPAKLIGGTDGTPIANIGSKLRVSNKPYIYDIAAFGIANHFPIYLFGYTSGVNAALVDVWESVAAALYVFPTAPIQMAVVSSSVNDTAAGTGIRTVDIEYLDTSYNMQVTTVTLNGTTPVNTTPTNILRVNQFHAMSAGTGGSAAGNISLTSVGGATTYSRITISHNFARQIIYTVPLGKTLFISGISASTTTAASGHSQEINLRATSSPSFELTPGLFMFKDLTILDNTTTHKNFNLPIAIPALADIKVSAISDGANAAVISYTLEGWIE